MKHCIAATIGLLVSTGCASHAPSTDRTPPPTPSKACDTRTTDALRAWADAGFSGTVAVSTRGRLRCAVAFGDADRARHVRNTVETVFSLGSIAKSFTAAAVLVLADAGRLSLDDRAGALVPGLRGPAARATVRQLLLHTSGLTGTHGTDHKPLTRADAIAAIGSLEQAFAPGSKFLYSNAGYTRLALIVDQVAGNSFRDYMLTHILTLPGGDVIGGFWDGEPAARGPRAVGYREDGPSPVMGRFAGPHWAIDGNGDIAMSTADLARWTHELFAGRLLSRQARRALLTLRHDGEQDEAPGWVVFDRAVFGQPVFTSAGGGGDVGHDAIVAWLPRSRTVVAMASNTPGVTAEELMAAIGPAVVAGEPLPAPRAAGGDVDPDALRAVAGTYRLPAGGSFIVAAKGRRLAVTALGKDAVAALMPLYGGFTAEDASAHERRVIELLERRTAEGRRERAGLERAFGAITGIALAGTIVHDGELRTYAEVTAAAKRVTLWYALDEQGGIQAAQGPARPPALSLVAAGPGRFRPDAPAGGAPDVLVEVADGELTATGPSGVATAKPAS
jgi:CubicO group peptidase (beta-lactamase class C family)